MRLKLKHKYYLSTYILGYIIALILSGVPSILYVIPIKLIGLLFSIGFGNSFYLHKEQQVPFTSMILVNVKNTVICMAILIASMIIKEILLELGVNISFITAPF